MTGMGRETGLAKDQRQERPRMPGTLNPGGFGAMTAILDVRSHWRCETSRDNRLTEAYRHRYRGHGKSGRNSAFSVMEQMPDSVQTGFSA